MQKYKFRKYNKIFPRLYKKEEEKLKKIFPHGVIIEHVGSTSVPDLGGKGIIDIAIKIPTTKASKFIDKLEELGYEETPEHPRNDNSIFLQKKIRYGKKERRIHIHLVLNDAFWNTFISLRDYLREHKTERKKYEGIKKEAVKFAKGEGKKYRKYKEKYLENLTKKALNHKKTKREKRK